MLISMGGGRLADPIYVAGIGFGDRTQVTTGAAFVQFGRVALVAAFLHLDGGGER